MKTRRSSVSDANFVKAEDGNRLEEIQKSEAMTSSPIIRTLRSRVITSDNEDDVQTKNRTPRKRRLSRNKQRDEESGEEGLPSSQLSSTTFRCNKLGDIKEDGEETDKVGTRKLLERVAELEQKEKVLPLIENQNEEFSGKIEKPLECKSPIRSEARRTESPKSHRSSTNKSCETVGILSPKFTKKPSSPKKIFNMESTIDKVEIGKAPGTVQHLQHSDTVKDEQTPKKDISSRIAVHEKQLLTTDNEEITKEAIPVTIKEVGEETDKESTHKLLESADELEQNEKKLPLIENRKEECSKKEKQLEYKSPIRSEARKTESPSKNHRSSSNKSCETVRTLSPKFTKKLSSPESIFNVESTTDKVEIGKAPDRVQHLQHSDKKDLSPRVAVNEKQLLKEDNEEIMKEATPLTFRKRNSSGILSDKELSDELYVSTVIVSSFEKLTLPKHNEKIVSNTSEVDEVNNKQVTPIKFRNMNSSGKLNEKELSDGRNVSTPLLDSCKTLKSPKCGKKTLDNVSEIGEDINEKPTPITLRKRISSGKVSDKVLRDKDDDVDSCKKRKSPKSKKKILDISVQVDEIENEASPIAVPKSESYNSDEEEFPSKSSDITSEIAVDHEALETTAYQDKTSSTETLILNIEFSDEEDIEITHVKEHSSVKDKDVEVSVIDKFSTPEVEEQQVRLSPKSQKKFSSPKKLSETDEVRDDEIELTPKTPRKRRATSRIKGGTFAENDQVSSTTGDEIECFSSPKSIKKSFSPKKLFKSSGVRQEIDVYGDRREAGGMFQSDTTELQRTKDNDGKLSDEDEGEMKLKENEISDDLKGKAESTPSPILSHTTSKNETSFGLVEEKVNDVEEINSVVYSTKKSPVKKVKGGLKDEEMERDHCMGEENLDDSSLQQHNKSKKKRSGKVMLEKSEEIDKEWTAPKNKETASILDAYLNEINAERMRTSEATKMKREEKIDACKITKEDDGELSDEDAEEMKEKEFSVDERGYAESTPLPIALTISKRKKSFGSIGEKVNDVEEINSVVYSTKKSPVKKVEGGLKDEEMERDHCMGEENVDVSSLQQNNKSKKKKSGKVMLKKSEKIDKEWTAPKNKETASVLDAYLNEINAERMRTSEATKMKREEEIDATKRTKEDDIEVSDEDVGEMNLKENEFSNDEQENAESTSSPILSHTSSKRKTPYESLKNVMEWTVSEDNETASIADELSDEDEGEMKLKDNEFSDDERGNAESTPSPILSHTISKRNTSFGFIVEEVNDAEENSVEYTTKKAPFKKVKGGLKDEEMESDHCIGEGNMDDSSLRQKRKSKKKKTSKVTLQKPEENVMEWTVSEDNETASIADDQINIAKMENTKSAKMIREKEIDPSKVLGTSTKKKKKSGEVHVSSNERIIEAMRVVGEIIEEEKEKNVRSRKHKKKAFKEMSIEDTAKDKISKKKLKIKEDAVERAAVESGSDGEMPEAISFNAGKEQSSNALLMAAEAIRLEKKKRKELRKKRMEMIVNQKAEKEHKRREQLKSLESSLPERLDDAIISQLPDQPEIPTIRSAETEKKKKKAMKEFNVKKEEHDEVLPKKKSKISKFEDYIPIEEVGAATKFGVVPLEVNMKIPQSLSESAAEFKKKALLGFRVRREPTKNLIAYKQKLTASDPARMKFQRNTYW